MKNLEELLKNYKCSYTFGSDLSASLDVKPVKGKPGMPFTVYGSFAKNELTNLSLFGVQFAGYMNDDPGDENDEESHYRIIEAILDGHYEYTLRRKLLTHMRFTDDICLSIGAKGEIIKDFRCVDQKGLKRLYNSGELKTVAYEKNS